ncbi:MAG: hypothetical protein M1826_003483 [Phylliscum demangeonii]|nr:MAG: hypothetical protein M1826_003483 [Phylliscum demangeonii]
MVSSKGQVPVQLNLAGTGPHPDCPAVERAASQLLSPILTSGLDSNPHAGQPVLKVVEKSRASVRSENEAKASNGLSDERRAGTEQATFSSNARSPIQVEEDGETDDREGAGREGRDRNETTDAVICDGSDRNACRRPTLPEPPISVSHEDDEPAAEIPLLVHLPFALDPPIDEQVDVPGRHGRPNATALIPPQPSPTPGVVEPSSSVEAAEEPTAVVLPGTAVANNRTGFLSLPGELRNQIYRLVFVDKVIINITSGQGLARSAALLRTCRLVYQEGRQILYGENAFAFRRKLAPRQHSRWARVEIDTGDLGYYPMELFLKAVGPHNLCQIRELSLVLEDCRPLPADFFAIRDRYLRYLDDENLAICLKMIAIHIRLDWLTLSFHGRHVLNARTMPGFHFVALLRQIRARHVDIIPGDRIAEALIDPLKTAIMRDAPRQPPPCKKRPIEGWVEMVKKVRTE